MNMVRSRLALLGSFTLALSLAGCDSGGPEAFAPGTQPTVAPDSSSPRKPLGPASPEPTSQKRFKSGTLPTQGPQEHP